MGPALHARLLFLVVAAFSAQAGRLHCMMLTLLLVTVASTQGRPAGASWYSQPGLPTILVSWNARVDGVGRG